MTATKLTWLGHGGWSIDTGKHTILVDPFLSANPVAPMSANDVKADFILVSHGHSDHISDVPDIARRTGAQVVAAFEIVQWLHKKHGIENTVGMNLGGTTRLPFGHLRMTNALHSSELPDGSYGGNPAGYVITIADQRIYFACDTALFGDMQMLSTPALDVAVLPIGDLFTMGPEDSVKAIQLLAPRFVLPAHYNTWPPIAQDPNRWATMVRDQTSAQPIVLEPGGYFDVPRGNA